MNKILKDLFLKNKLAISSWTCWYKITPELARHLLDLNVKNYRSLSNSRVNRYANEMISGKWKRNGQTIVINKDGSLLQDGQHRLHAIIKSGVTITCLVVFDADETDVYDFGMNRSVYSIFRAEGKPISNFHISTGSALISFGIGNNDYGGEFVHDYVEKRIDLIKIASSIVSSSGTLAKKAPCAALVYCLLSSGEISESDMRSFFKVVNSGITFGYAKEASPALVLRKQFEQMKGGGAGLRKLQLEITYKALRDFKLGNPRKQNYKDDTNDAVRLLHETYENNKNKETAA